MTSPDANALHAHVWPGSATRTPDGAVEIGGADVRDLVAEHGTPVYLLDEADVRRRAAAFRDAFASAFERIGTRADVYYAGKAFLSTAVARWVTEEGLRVDVCTGGELAIAQRAGVPGPQIGMHGNNKSVAEIEAAVEHGVGRIIVDSFEEVDRVAAAARARGVVQPVMIRVKAGVEAHTHEFIATAHEDQKFGFSLSGGQVAEAVTAVLEHPDALRLLGFHSHIGSQIFESDGFRVAATRLIALQLEVAREHGITLPELDLGGGFGIAYVADDQPLAPDDLAGQLADIVQAACREQGVPVPHVSVEPGRSVVGPGGVTVYEVGTVKPVQATDDLVRTYVAVDGGMSDNARPALYAADYTCVVAGRTSAAEPVPARVVGKHCESGDIVVRDVQLPGDVRAGDLIAVPATGAYCRSLASQYNHVPRPPVVAVRDGASRVIVRRETIDDLLALEGE
ncbi:diaminopimelate decarboxylase [Luteipulveratus halotolerans]|uniref:diaminopimelate decarboxylase n=1 Tax=Luteipulveratus halotolerans TaxID=1631356 RepID=UPI000682F296|nr:diaminopimelate decarboxylase [Luteipulveratus halotolerans]